MSPQHLLSGSAGGRVHRASASDTSDSSPERLLQPRRGTREHYGECGRSSNAVISPKRISWRIRPGSSSRDRHLPGDAVPERAPPSIADKPCHHRPGTFDRSSSQNCGVSHVDAFAQEHPSIRVVRLRPGLIFKREAATGIRRLFADPLLASPLLPSPPSRRAGGRGRPACAFQAVHSLDVGDAYRRAILGDARGPYNIAADPPLDGELIARALGARSLPVRSALLRRAASISWRLRLQPLPPGWIDLAFSVPIMDTHRARTEIGWAPRVSATEALVELSRSTVGSSGPRLRRSTIRELGDRRWPCRHRPDLTVSDLDLMMCAPVDRSFRRDDEWH